MVSARYFDGRSTRVHAVTLVLLGDELSVTGQDLDFRIRFDQVKVDERLGQAARRLRFPDGGFCEVSDLPALDALLASTGHRDGYVDRLQRQIKSVLLALLACALLVIVGYKLVLPWAAARGARHLPPIVGQTLSTQALRALDGRLLLASEIPSERQRALIARYNALSLPEGGAPKSQMLFRRSPQLGANAFTLPDGTIVVLDDLVTALDDDHKVMAVMAHELGHAHGYHGLQLLLRSSIVGAFLTFYIGDISQLLAAAPAAVVQARYSQDLEREADDYGAALLQRNGLSPALMADVLQVLIKTHPGAKDGGYLASHPSTTDRIRHLRSMGAPALSK